MSNPLSLTATKTLLESTDLRRLEASKLLDLKRRAEMGQFFTPAPVARFMASMLSKRRLLSVLDAGSGVGSLVAACVDEAIRWTSKPEKISITTYEIEPTLISLLQETLTECELVCKAHNIDFEYRIYSEDFIQAAVDHLQGSFFASRTFAPNVAVLNPPYQKINSSSITRKLLRTVGIETSNLYTAFLWLVANLLEPGGEIISITPRSFCNGPYFLPFRRAFLNTLRLKRLHAFTSRNRTFQDDDVLQENIILQAVKSLGQNSVVKISTSVDVEDDYISVRDVEYKQVVKLDDPEYFIHVVPDEISYQINQHISGLDMALDDLGISVSTGRIVDFRSKPFLREKPSNTTVPLIYPHHFSDGFIKWPNGNYKKPCAIEVTNETKELLVASGYYVLVKRFSPKEEKRRVVAAVYDSGRFAYPVVGFENHVNYFHLHGSGLRLEIAKGLAAFLNSTLVDQYFRQFNGHTQVNASDLRKLKYPTESKLYAIGLQIGDSFPSQDELDRIVLQELNIMPSESSFDPIQARRRIEEALEILKALDMPREQQNERSALTLLAILGIKPETLWFEASDPMRGITEIMDFCRDYFGVKYAPNTRETFRRFTMHQFVQTGFVIMNPDKSRAPNSPKTCYQIESNALNLLRSYGSKKWDENLTEYLKTAESLRRLQSQEREMQLIPVKLPSGKEIKLSGGGQNRLIKSIIEDFCPRFTPDGVVVYVGDAGQKIRGDEIEYLRRLGVIVDEHGKMPDVIIHFKKKNWLVIVEAVTSHGPINIKRHNELKVLFKDSKVGLVFVTAFENRKTMVKYLREIAWETDVWISETPTHLIHFNGERFLGPY